MITIKIQEPWGETTVTLPDNYTQEPQVAAQAIKDFWSAYSKGAEAMQDDYPEALDAIKDLRPAAQPAPGVLEQTIDQRLKDYGLIASS